MVEIEEFLHTASEKGNLLQQRGSGEMGSKDRFTTADCLCNLWHNFSERSTPSVQTEETASSRNRQGFFYTWRCW